MKELDFKLQKEIASGEEWLSTFPAPSPSPAALERTKQAVHEELTRLQGARAITRRWAAWHGVVAAAASIALAVTVGWYSFVHGTKPPVGPVNIESLVAWSADTREEVTRFAGLDEGLSDLEDWSAEQPWAANGASLYEAIEGALEEDANPPAGDTGAMTPPSMERRRGNAVT
jgi:hypothetical protein